MKKTEVNNVKIINWNNYKQSPGEQNSGEYLLVPDQAYTIPEIFEKFRRGINLQLEREVAYSDTEDFDNFDIRQVVKDPYDVDEEVIRRQFLKTDGKGVILGGGLPEGVEQRSGLAQPDGVKTTGNNSETGEAKN